MGKIHQLLGAAALMTLGSISSVQASTGPSYTFDQSPACGSWCYYDLNFTKLTDGVLGTAGWAANQGAEWVGWESVPAVNITFQFSGAQTFSSVSVGSTQDNLGDVALPSFQLWAFQGSSWVQVGNISNPPSSANDNWEYSSAPHPMYTFSGLNVTTDKLRVTATANGPWIFMDEVTFSATTPVPEPSSWAMLLGGLGVAALARVRSKR